uniref:Uncharacterized protein n=1 Tax=Populus trichocarpa TaxID=3694 RepID=A9P8W2_POPTR|nr:unknown [Populus trichocarpa]
MPQTGPQRQLELLLSKLFKIGWMANFAILMFDLKLLWKM